MRSLFVLIALLAPLSANAFSYATGGCASSGCAQGEQWEYTNANEVDTALDTLETTSASHTSSISTLTGTFASYLPLAGGTMTGNIVLGGTAIISVPTNTTIAPSGSGVIIATIMSGSKQIGDDDLADGAVDLDGLEVSGTLPDTKGGTGLTSLGTGVATALGTNVGSAGSPVLNAGALGTPSSGTGTNLTGIPIATGISGSSANLRTALSDESGTGAAVFAGGDVGAATGTTAAGEDNDTSIATTAYVQGEFGDLGAYTVGTSAPTDGSTACTNGDMYLDESANKIYFCVDSATDDWFGVALTDTP